MSLTLEELGYTPDRYGLMDRLLVRHVDQGGTLAFLTGIQGCGKTTVELHLAHASMMQGEIVFWRGRHVDSWHAFPGPVKVWANYPVRVLRAPLDEPDAVLDEWLDVPVHEFDGPEDLIARAEPGCLNVVYAKEDVAIWADPERDEAPPLLFWDAMVVHLAHKTTTRWHTLIVDEMHELWWDRPEGDDYARQGRVRDALADFRKTFNSLIGASHQVDECDYRILAKLQFQIYGRGAKPHAKSRVHKTLTLNLGVGEFILDSLYFATVSFPKIPKPRHQLFVRPGASSRSVPRDAYEEDVEHFLDDQVRKIELHEIQSGQGMIVRDGWNVMSCGCTFRRNGQRFETRPCRADRSCEAQRMINEEGRRLGLPVRFEAWA